MALILFFQQHFFSLVRFILSAAVFVFSLTFHSILTHTFISVCLVGPSHKTEFV